MELVLWRSRDVSKKIYLVKKKYLHWFAILSKRFQHDYIIVYISKKNIEKFDILLTTHPTV